MTQQIFEDACREGKLDIVEKCINRGFFAKIFSPIDLATGLRAAINSHQTQIVTFLVNNGADMNTKTGDGQTIFMTAISQRNKELTQFLIEKGANIEVKSANGNTPLMSAISSGNLELVKFLIECGINVNDKTKNDTTPLMKAALRGYTDIVKELLQTGASVNDKTTKGETALIKANSRGYKDIVEFLIAHGAKGELKKVDAEAEWSDTADLAPQMSASTAEIRSNGATNWFQNSEMRGQPRSSNDFIVTGDGGIPYTQIPIWFHQVSRDPWTTRMGIVPIKEMGTSLSLLSECLQNDHGVSDEEMQSVFDKFVGVVCIDCLAGITVDMLRTVSLYNKAGGVFLSDTRVMRLPQGKCNSCDFAQSAIISFGAS